MRMKRDDSSKLYQSLSGRSLAKQSLPFGKQEIINTKDNLLWSGDTEDGRTKSLGDSGAKRVDVFYQAPMTILEMSSLRF